MSTILKLKTLNKRATRQAEVLSVLEDHPDQSARSILERHMPLYDMTRLRRKLVRLEQLGFVTRRRVPRTVVRSHTLNGKRSVRVQQRLVDLWRAA